MHVGIIMDGNGRWAQRRGLPRTAGHRAGARAVRVVVESAVKSRVDVLTLYAFSSDNWCRPPDEVTNLMTLFERYLISEAARCAENGVRVCVIGRRDRLSAKLVGVMEHVEKITASGDRLTLQLAVDYSSRTAIREAAMQMALAEQAPDFERCLADAMHAACGVASVDLLIRTGGEQRLSDFLLWECAYAELLFVDTCWPDFDDGQFCAALEEFGRRQRRFGRLASAPAAMAVPGAGR